ncbi:MAG: ABC transporter permease [Planctomycetota bacterium]|nr:MAG: ABC transporter permease [Planctomycetota bacterium]
MRPDAAVDAWGRRRTGRGLRPTLQRGQPGGGTPPPFWWPADALQKERLDAIEQATGRTPRYWLGTDVLGRSLLTRILTGGGISLGIGIAAAFISVFIGTLYGGLAGYVGGKTDAVLMRIVDVLYGLPYILLVVLLAVASEAIVAGWISQEGARDAWVQSTLKQSNMPSDQVWLEEPASDHPEFVNLILARVERAVNAPDAQKIALAEVQDEAAIRSAGEVLTTAASIARPPKNVRESSRLLLDVGTLLLAIGGVSWLTMARVIRGQVLSLKEQPFVEAAQATGATPFRIFTKHLLPNLLGPIIVYATLTVPQAILQESFLSFLGIGVKPPLPSWGNLAADGLSELNTYRSHWWLLLFPCLLLGVTLLALNFVGEGLREAFDPKRARR